MNIKTKTFQVTPKQLKQLIINQYFQTRKRLLITLTVILILFLIMTFFAKYFISLALYFAFLLFLLLIAPFRINMKKIQPVINFIARYWEIDEDFICIYYEDGSIRRGGALAPVFQERRGHGAHGAPADAKVRRLIRRFSPDRPSRQRVR